MEVEKTSITSSKFLCEICDFKCSKKGDFSRHLTTDKHKKMQNGSILEVKEENKTPDLIDLDKHLNFKCECGKSFKTHSGMWKHKKRCKKEETEIDEEQDNMMLSLMLEVVKSNSDFKNLLVEQNKQMMETFQEVCKNGINNNINSHNNINSNNKAFNLQFFLNETCKDAMNIGDFVNSIKFDLADYEKIGELGFIEGMSDIIIRNIKMLDVTMRPVHNMDSKRETVYLKDQGVWEKSSDDDNKKLRKSIKKMTHTNFKNINLFKDKYPGCMGCDSKYGEMFFKYQKEACGGTHDDYYNETKIITKLAKEITVDKKM